MNHLKLINVFFAMLLIFLGCNSEERLEINNSINEEKTDISQETKKALETWTDIERLFSSEIELTYHNSGSVKALTERCGELPCNVELSWFENGKLESIRRNTACYLEKAEDIETGLLIETTYCDFTKYSFDEEGGVSIIELSKYPFTEKSYFTNKGIIKREYLKLDSLIKVKNYN
jgi:hypothetical protein